MLTKTSNKSNKDNEMVCNVLVISNFYRYKLKLIFTYVLCFFKYYVRKLSDHAFYQKLDGKNDRQL